MPYQKSELYFLATLIVGVSVLLFFVFKPFLFSLLLALVFATVFAPTHSRLLNLTHQKEGLSALLSMIFVLLVIVVPITFLGIQIFKEANQLYVSLANNGGTISLIRGLEEFIRSLGIPYLPSGPVDFSLYAKQTLGFVVQNLGVVFSNVAKMAVDIFIFLVALYYLFKDGNNIKKLVITLSPLQDVYDKKVFEKLERAVNSVVKGNMTVSLVQGTLTAIGLAIFGVPNPILWGSVAAVTALIPGIGTSLVLIPSIIFLYVTGHAIPALGLLAWAFAGVGLVDNFLGPRLVGRGVQLHPFLILLSILGGVGVFGPLGFLLGPLALSLLFAFLEIYAILRKESSC